MQWKDLFKDEKFELNNAFDAVARDELEVVEIKELLQSENVNLENIEIKENGDFRFYKLDGNRVKTVFDNPIELVIDKDNKVNILESNEKAWGLSRFKEVDKKFLDDASYLNFAEIKDGKNLVISLPSGYTKIPHKV